MVNLIAERQVVPEFVQHRAGVGPIARAVVDLLRNDERATQMRAALRDVRRQLGPPGAMGRAADAVLQTLKTCRS
jgi:lipid-A-disaccharide synthase